MSRTKGAVDRTRRKGRSDLGKKRDTYAGKKTKPRRKVNGKFVSYKSKRKRDDPIRVEFWRVRQMSHEGYMHFSKSTRRKMHPYVYGGKEKLCFIVDHTLLSTKENISEIACDHLWEGTWLIMLRSHSKNTHHNSPRAFGTLRITQHPEGLNCKVTPSYKRRSLRRLFFWRDE